MKGFLIFILFISILLTDIKVKSLERKIEIIEIELRYQR